MPNRTIQDAISSAVKPTVNAPRVGRPSPFDDRRMNISDRFRPEATSTNPNSFGSRESDDRDITYTGDINVTGLGVDVADQFGGLTSGIRTALGPLGLAGIASIGGGISQGSLTKIQDKMRQGIPGYGIGMLNGRIVGVSPGGALTGVLPTGLSGLQRKQIANQLLQMNPTTALVGGLIPTKDDPDPPPPTATASVVDKILSGVDPEAAGYEAGLFSDTLGGTVTGRADAYAGQQGGIEPPAAPSVTPVDYYPTADDVINDPYRDVPPGLAVMTAQDFNFGYDPPGDYSYFGDVTSPASQPSDDGGGAPREKEDADASQSAGLGGGSSTDYESEAYGVGGSDPFDDSGRFGAKGGRVGMAEGGSADPVQGNGFVEGSPDNYTKKQTIADDEYRRVRPGSFIMNAPMTEKLQEAGLLPKGVDNPAKKSTIKANKGGMIDVALSKGEYVFEPEEAKAIGYDTLNKINDMGKPEVDRRQALREGGLADLSDIKIAGDEYIGTNVSGFHMLGAKALGVGDEVNRAIAVAREYERRHPNQDIDRPADTLRHILLSGYMHRQSEGFKGFLEGVAADSIDSREGTDQFVEESAIDLNNNQYGRKLREKFPDPDDFTRAAVAVVEMLRKGEAFEVDGMKPQMSIGYDQDDRQNFDQGGTALLPEQSPIRKKKIEGIAFADQELRNDLDKYLRGNPLGQLGYELVRMGQYEIRAGFAPKGKTSTLGGFTGSPKDSREKFESDTYRNRRTDTPVDQDAGVVFYYAGPNTKIKKIDGKFFRDIEEPRTDTDMRILTHELGHVGMRFLEEVQKKASGNPGYRFNPTTEEYMMRVGDEIIRERNNLAYTKFSVTDPVEYEAVMYNRGRPPRYFLEKDSPEYNMYKKEWVKNSKQAQTFLEKQFGFIPEVKASAEKTYAEKFKELFGFGK